MKRAKKSVMGRVEDISTEEIRMPEDVEDAAGEDAGKSPIRNAKRKKAEKEASAEQKPEQAEAPAPKEKKPGLGSKRSAAKDASNNAAQTEDGEEVRREFPKQLILYILTVITILIFVVLKLYDSVGWQQDVPTYILAFVLIAIGCSISPVTSYIINKRAENRVVKANTYYLELTFTNDKSARSQLIKALISSAQGNAERTEIMLEKLLERCSVPQEFASIYTIMGGNAAKNAGDPQKAIECYEKAIAREAGFAGAWYGLAVAHMRLDDLRPAQEELVHARELGYDRAKVRRALEVIDEMLEDDSRVSGVGSGYSSTAAVEEELNSSDAGSASQSAWEDSAELANAVKPFNIFERDGKYYSVLSTDLKYKADIFAARETEGFMGSGYDWENLAKVLINEELQEYDGVIDFDSNASMFSAFSTSKGVLRHFITAFAQVCESDEKMADLLSRAMPS